MEILKLNKKIYQLTAIKKAMAEFESSADFQLKEDDNFFNIQITARDADLKNIIHDEFANFVLGLMS